MIVIFQNNKITYTANLKIIFDLESSKSNRDMQFPITCISDDKYSIIPQRYNYGSFLWIFNNIPLQDNNGLQTQLICRQDKFKLCR